MMIRAYIQYIFSIGRLPLEPFDLGRCCEPKAINKYFLS